MEKKRPKLDIMETNQFDNQPNKTETETQPQQLTGRPFEFAGAPTLNGKYNQAANLTNPSSSLSDAVAESSQSTTITTSPEPKLHLSLVIPAYNEAVRLPDTLAQVLKWLESQPYQSEILVVDDGSNDNTAAIVKRLIIDHQATPVQAINVGGERCRLRLIENPHRGKGFAVRTGMLQGQGDLILFSDADLCTPISETNKLLFWLDQGFDVSIGSREGIGARRYGEPAYRHLMGRVFNLIVRLVTSSPFQDTQCGFKAFTRQSAHDLFDRVQLYADDSPPVQGAMVTGFDVEVLFLALKRNYRVKEVPVEWYHVKGSKVSPVKDSLRMLRDIVSVRLNDIKGVYRR